MWPRLALGTIGLLVVRVSAGVLSRAWFLLRQVWHEAIGFLFLALAVMGTSTIIREWHAGFGLGVLLALGFTVMMVCFGVASFRSARKVRQEDQSRHR